jgi:hypothetical protein
MFSSQVLALLAGGGVRGVRIDLVVVQIVVFRGKEVE